MIILSTTIPMQYNIPAVNVKPMDATRINMQLRIWCELAPLEPANRKRGNFFILIHNEGE